MRPPPVWPFAPDGRINRDPLDPRCWRQVSKLHLLRQHGYTFEELAEYTRYPPYREMTATGLHEVLRPEVIVELWDQAGVPEQQRAEARKLWKPFFDQQTARGHALYRHWNAFGRLLYVGISLNAVARLVGHRQTAPWFGEIVEVTVDHYPSREEARAAEVRAIKTEKPAYNQRDD